MKALVTAAGQLRGQCTKSAAPCLATSERGFGPRSLAPAGRDRGDRERQAARDGPYPMVRARPRRVN